MIRFIHELTDDRAGGKALGLKVLSDLGFNVPGAFVLIHPDPEKLDGHLIREHLELLGEGPKAVRSSAMSEDGSQASFAGQFDTFLHLQTFEEIMEAIRNCIGASSADRVRDYSARIMQEADLRISVILQNMVHARFAGVIFSVNPVNGRRDKVLAEVVAGTGDHLVGGTKDGYRYELFRSGSDIQKQADQYPGMLSAKNIRELLEGAKKAEHHFGVPVDLEWAIDQEDHVQWLQVRPVTALSEVHYNELDTLRGEAQGAWTLGNIGEMMPGVVTPLTYSVSAEAIDYGMMVLSDKAGAFSLKDRNGMRYIQMFYNRLFINMSNLMDYPKRIWLNKPSDVQFALSGKVFPEITARPEAPLPVRVVNFFRQIFSTARSSKYLHELRKLEKEFTIDLEGDMETIHRNLGIAREKLGVGFGHHLMTSAQSGTLYSAFIRIMTGDKRPPDAEDHHLATMLLLHIPDIESADAVKSLDRFAKQIREESIFAAGFTASDAAEALNLLENSAPESIRESFRLFMSRHGHRCVREAELREKTWADDPLHLIRAIQTQVKMSGTRRVTEDPSTYPSDKLDHIPFFKKLILRSLIPSARKAVAKREISKALSIRMVDAIRKGYRHLASELVGSNLLDDMDQVFFLTHEEIGKLLKDKSPSWKTRASKRRDLLPETHLLRFAEVNFGIPEPLEVEIAIETVDGQLRGTPVSQGVVTGKARIVNTLEEADKLEEGEIMIASFSDVGWTPYFSIIGGLVTEIGSPLSHGAVVAREYGIPAVVGAKGARKFLESGQIITVDGNRGTILKGESQS